MSTVFDNLTERATGMQGRDDFRGGPVTVSYADDKTGQVRDYTLDRNEQYALTAILTVTYWANRAQRADARKIAEKTLASLLYADLLRDVALVRHAISDGDAARAMTELSNLEHRYIHGATVERG